MAIQRRVPRPFKQAEEILRCALVPARLPFPPCATRQRWRELSPNPTLPLYLFLLSFFFFHSRRTFPSRRLLSVLFNSAGDILLTEHKYRPSGSTIRSHLISSGSTLRA